jgi:F0F1-type ATP synthase membrane subunit b/b'
MTEILEQLEINQTFFYQFILFGVFFFVLSGLYLKPFQRLLEKRNHKLKDDVQSATELLRTVESRLSDYERALHAARADALKHYESAIAEVRAKEDAQIAQIKSEIKKDFLRASDLLQDEKLKIESELKLQINQFSDSLVQKLITGTEAR